MRTQLRLSEPKSRRSLRRTGVRLTAARSQRRTHAAEAFPVVMVTEPQQELRSRANEFIEQRRIESPGRDTLQLYLREIGQVKLLTPKEEIALAMRISRGDKIAREEMIKANLRLVVKIAHD